MINRSPVLKDQCKITGGITTLDLSNENRSAITNIVEFLYTGSCAELRVNATSAGDIVMLWDLYRLGIKYELKDFQTAILHKITSMTIARPDDSRAFFDGFAKLFSEVGKLDQDELRNAFRLQSIKIFKQHKAITIYEPLKPLITKGGPMALEIFEAQSRALVENHVADTSAVTMPGAFAGCSTWPATSPFVFGRPASMSPTQNSQTNGRATSIGPKLNSTG